MMTTTILIPTLLLGPIILPLWIMCTAAMWKLLVDGIKEVLQNRKVKKALKKQLENK